MKRCQRCRNPSLQVLRESVTYRHGRQYCMTWLTCPRCQEVNFSFHLLDDLGITPQDTGAAIDWLIDRQEAGSAH